MNIMKIIGKTWTILIFPKMSGLIYDYNDKLKMICNLYHMKKD